MSDEAEEMIDRLMEANATPATGKRALAPSPYSIEQTAPAIDFACGRLDALIAASAWADTLAANLRDAAGCALAAYCGEIAGIAAVYADRGVTINAWRPEQGRAWPGWER